MIQALWQILLGADMIAVMMINHTDCRTNVYLLFGGIVEIIVGFSYYLDTKSRNKFFESIPGSEALYSAFWFDIRRHGAINFIEGVVISIIYVLFGCYMSSSLLAHSISEYYILLPTAISYYLYWLTKLFIGPLSIAQCIHGSNQCD